MLDNPLIMIAIGSLLGFLAGIGVGGGSLLILWLSLVVGLDYAAAKAINLLFFLPTAVIATLFRWRQGHLNIRAILPAIIAGCVSAACFSVLSRHIDIDLVQKLFGILLLLTGLKELFYHPKEKL